MQENKSDRRTGRPAKAKGKKKNKKRPVKQTTHSSEKQQPWMQHVLDESDVDFMMFCFSLGL
jgi:hypothetical protein